MTSLANYNITPINNYYGPKDDIPIDPHYTLPYQRLPPAAPPLPQPMLQPPMEYNPMFYYPHPPPPPPGPPHQQLSAGAPGYMPYYQGPYTSPHSSISMDQPFYLTSGHERRRLKQSSTWTPKEDKLLRELKEVQKLGWREISTFFTDRTPNACQFRWRRIISGTSTSTSSTSSSSKNNNEGSISEMIETHQEEPITSSPTASSPSTKLFKKSHMNKKSHHSINFILN